MDSKGIEPLKTCFLLSTEATKKMLYFLSVQCDGTFKKWYPIVKRKYLFIFMLVGTFLKQVKLYFRYVLNKSLIDHIQALREYQKKSQFVDAVSLDTSILPQTHNNVNC